MDRSAGTASKTSNDAIATVPISGEELKNRFGALGIEDTSDDLDLGVSDVLASGLGGAKRNSTQTSTVDVYELERQSDVDDAFIIFCFFEDLHRIQETLERIWKEYKDGKCELTIASVTTNLALNLVHRAEEELIASLGSKNYKKPRSYQALSMVIFYEDSFNRGEDPEEKLASNDSLRLTPFDESIYLSTARTLMKFQRLMELEIEYPQPVPPFRFNYISRPELLELPETKKMEAEDLLLNQLLMDSTWNDILRPGLKRSRGREPPAEDEFSDSLQKLRKYGEISLWTVFASKIMMDINRILGRDVKRSYQELLVTGSAASKTLDFHVEGDELVPGGGGECWHVKGADLPQTIHDITNFWIKEAPLASVNAMWLANRDPYNEPKSIDELPPDVRKQVMEQTRAKGFNNDDVLPEHKANAKKLDLRTIKPADDPAFAYNHNPLYCGTLAFNVAVDMEIAGLALANHQLTIFAIAHLCNACQQTKNLKGKWPEMDRIIEVHIGQLFSGQLPTKPSECRVHPQAILHGIVERQIDRRDRLARV